MRPAFQKKDRRALDAIGVRQFVSDRDWHLLAEGVEKPVHPRLFKFRNRHYAGRYRAV